MIWMKRIVGTALALLVASALTPGQTARKEAGPGESRAAAEIRKLETERFEAMIKVDAAALDRLLADDLTYIHSSGQLDSKATIISSLESGELQYVSVSPEGVAVRVQGGAAVVTGSARIRVKSKTQETGIRVRFTDVYLKRDGRWQMAAWQSTRLPEP